MNTSKLPIFALAALISVPVAFAAKPDSVRQLREIEVLGVKQMPSAPAGPVTLVDSTRIARLGIDAVKEIGEIVPNLYTPSYGSRMTSSIYMRGLGSRIDQAAVGLSVDGVPFLNKDVYDFDLPDIKSISVRRGAQSLLNGRNAMAGQISVYTLSPRDFQGYRFMAQYGRANSLKASAAGYWKLSPKLFSSLSLLYGHTDGFWKNDFNGRNVGLENNGTIRWKTVFTPSRAHTVTNTATFGIARQSGYPYASMATGRIAYGDTCYYRRNSFSDGLTVAWKGKRVVVNSLTSVQYLDDRMTLDQDFTPADYFTLTQKRHEWAFTEDLFAKGARGRYSWLGGVFGFYRTTDMDAPVTFLSDGIKNLIVDKRNEMNPHYPISWDYPVFPIYSDFKIRNYGFALYHQSVYKAGAWTFEAGLRWDIEKVGCDYTGMTNGLYTTWERQPDGSLKRYASSSASQYIEGHLHHTYMELLPKLTVSRSLPFGSVYASFTKGYKSGGVNTQMFSDIMQQIVMETMGLTNIYKGKDIMSYRPEYSWNYELGIKAHNAASTLSGEAVLFYIDCRDQQLTAFPPGTVTGRMMTNAGRTRSFGAELSGRYSPTSSLTFTASYGYTNATFREYNNGRADFRGKRIPYAPANTLFVSAWWLTPWRPFGLDTSVDATLRGIGNIMWNDENTLSQPFYALPGLSLTLASDKWSLRLWGENLTNTRYDTFYFLSMGNSFTQRGLPVTFGATLRLSLN